MASPYFGDTTGLNWTLNRQPLGSNASTASGNKTAISTACRHTASQLGCGGIIISGCYERGDSALSLQPRKRLSEREILVIIQVFVSLGGGKLDKLAWVVIIHSRFLFKGDTGLRAWGCRLSSLKRAGRWYLLCFSSSKTMPPNFKHPVPTYWSSVGTQTGHVTPETCRPGWEAWSVPPSGGCCCGTAPRSGTHPHLARQSRQPRDSERKGGGAGSGGRKWEDEVRGRFQGHKELSQTREQRSVLESER